MHDRDPQNSFAMSPDSSHPSHITQLTTQPKEEPTDQTAVNRPSTRIQAIATRHSLPPQSDQASLLAAAANLTDMVLGYDGKHCLPTLDEGPGGERLFFVDNRIPKSPTPTQGVPGDGPGPGPWG